MDNVGFDPRSRVTSGLVESLNNEALGVFRLSGRIEPVDGFTSVVHQKLLKVPSDVAHPHRGVVEVCYGGAESIARGGTRALEEGVYRVFPRTVHLNLVEKLEAWNKVVARTHPSHRVHDLGSIRSWLLQSELVTGKGEHLKLLRAVLGLQILQPVVVPGQTSEGGDVHNEQNLSFKP